jgi:hypothetical protein
MKMKKQTFLQLLFLFVSILAFSPSPSDGAPMCACCAETGTYMIYNGKVDEFELGLLKEIRFGKQAELFLTEAGEDAVKGFANVFPNYILTGGFASNLWKLDFRDPRGKTGTLQLPLPTDMTIFKADIHDGKTSGGGGPLLYKEWRFEGEAAGGGGFLAPSFASPAKYRFVLQGRGNGCDNAEDFTNWHVEVKGDAADYSFFGKLERQTANAPKAKKRRG